MDISPWVEKEGPLLKVTFLRLKNLNKKNLYYACVQFLTQKLKSKVKCVLGLRGLVMAHPSRGSSTNYHQKNELETYSGTFSMVR